MSLNRPTEAGDDPTLVDRLRVIYFKAMQVLVPLAVIAAAVGVILGYASIERDNDQDRAAEAAAKARDDGIREVLGCFNEYTTASSGTSVAVRAASVVVSERDALQTEVFEKWIGQLRNALIYPGDPEGAEALEIVQKFIGTTSSLQVALQRLSSAQDELAQVRIENPVPPAPEVFCAAAIPDRTSAD